jgi:hypothetical protein
MPKANVPQTVGHKLLPARASTKTTINMSFEFAVSYKRTLQSERVGRTRIKKQDLRLYVKRTSPHKPRNSTTGSRGGRVSWYLLYSTGFAFRGLVTLTGYPPLSPLSPSVPRQHVAVSPTADRALPTLLGSCFTMGRSRMVGSVGTLPPDDTASHPKTQQNSQQPLCET